MTQEDKTALVIGATGGVGGAVAAALLARGWRVKALNRKPESAATESPLTGVEWIRGDAMVTRDVVGAAHGARLIVHAANPPGYKDWDKLIIPMMEGSIDAAKAGPARASCCPGTSTTTDPTPGSVITESSPQRPVTRKGKLRVEMERRLKASGVRTLIVRAGDFFGSATAANSWFSQMVRRGKPVRSAVYPGARGVGHTWAYLPDLAETMVRLVEQEDRLEAHAVFNFGGHWFEHGEDIGRAILRVAEQPPQRLRGFPWPMVTLASPAVPLFRELLEMRYLWRRPLRLDNRKLLGFLGEEPHTATDRAIARSLDALGCLPAEWPLVAWATNPAMLRA